MVSNISHSGVLTQIRRDALRRETSRIDGRGNATRTEYDALGRVAATVDALTNATAYAYDPMGRVAAVTNALGDATVYEYDARGNRTYEGGATYPVRCTYDVYGNRTTMTTYRHEGGTHSVASVGDTTTWIYDEASGVMTNKLYADGKGPRYTYTDDGRLATRTWARGIVTAYAYDGWGNLTNTSYSDDTPTVTIAYDAMGRQLEASDAAGVTTFAYDAYGANTNETVIGVAGTNTIERFTDPYGRDAGYALNGARQTILGRDPATGRIETMQTAGCTNAFRWTYLPGSDMKHTLRYPNGALVTWEYEPRRNLMTLVSNDVYSTFSYAYDEVGKRVSKNNENYEYNFRGELILATNIVTGSEFAYGYDDIGNRLWSREFGTNCTYVANELNQYTNIIRGGVFECSAFDLDGNQTNVITSTGEWEVKYNGENRPVRWGRATDGITVRMCYDRMGRRVLKNDETFVYDNNLNVSETIWDATEMVATKPLVWLNDEGVSFYFYDGNRNVTEMIVGKNAVQEHYEYAPFGEMLTRAEIMAPFLFSSEMFDFEIGISYYNLRQLNSRSGRWLCREPWSMVKGLNLYWFVLNAPISSFDIRGLAASRWGDPFDDVNERFRISPYLDYVSVDELLKDPFRGILIDDVIGLIREMGGLPMEEYLSHCPCCIEDAYPSDGWTLPEKSGHEGGHLEVRRKFGNNSGGGQQCVYDRSGRLINEGKAAGTPDRVHPDTRINKALHMILDGWPYALFHPIDFIADKLGQDTDLATAVDHWWNPPDKGMDQYGNPCPSNQGP